MKTAFRLLLACAFPLGLTAGTTLAAPAAAPAETPAAATAAPRSSFNAPAEGSPAARNPFVPIGYVRPVAVVKEIVQIPTVTADQFVVTSYSLEPPPLAVINGRTYGVGERVPVDKDGKEFVTVRQIRDGSVVLDHRGRTFVCESKRRGGGPVK